MEPASWVPWVLAHWAVGQMGIQAWTLRWSDPTDALGSAQLNGRFGSENAAWVRSGPPSAMVTSCPSPRRPLSWTTRLPDTKLWRTHVDLSLASARNAAKAKSATK